MKRIEIKYYLPKLYSDRIIFDLGQYYKKDKNIGTKGFYTNSSLYFDTITYQDSEEKFAGINQRSKYRLRVYNRNLDYGKLEKKWRIGPTIGKISGNLNNKEILNFKKYCVTNNFLDHNTKNLVTSINAFGYKPSAIVEYDRIAFSSGDCRFTLDKNLRCFITTNGFFNNDFGSGIPVFEENYDILEIKIYSKVPKLLKKIINHYPLTRASISKYVMCLKYINDNDRFGDFIGAFF